MIGPLPCIGGKRRLAATIVRLLPTHTTYVEPFAGGAQVLFHKPPSAVEVLNDLDGEIVNFFRICRRHPDELARVLRFQPLSRQWFAWSREPPPPDATDVERAARFFYRQKNAWGGKRTHQSFRIGIARRPGYAASQLATRFERVAHRLERVILECGAYEEILSRYDRSSTVFYCDPPYIDVHLYPQTLNDAQFQALATHLGRLRGRFLLSINDCPKARDWFGRFHCQPVELVYTSTRRPARFPELLIANFPFALPRRP